MRIAIAPDLVQNESFSAKWVERLRARGHTAELVSVRAPDFLERVKSCDGFLWWFPPVPPHRDLGKRVMSVLHHVSDLVVYPDWRSCWHFDDKVAQAWLLRAAGIPMPRTWIAWDFDEAMDVLRDATYPLVVKLSFGFRGQRVGMLRDRREADAMAHRLFGDGVSDLRKEPRLRAIARPLRSWLRMASMECAERLSRERCEPPGSRRERRSRRSPARLPRRTDPRHADRRRRHAPARR
jgi:hypothetical protein